MYEVRAVFTESTVRVYQAYNEEIARAAVERQTFVAPWNPERMTWIKPSAAWMGYRSGWGGKDRNQARVLAIDLHREGFDWLLATARLAAGQPRGRRSEVVVQWDPERGLGGEAGKSAWTHALRQQRSLQMGLRGAVTQKFAEELISGITDVTELFAEAGRRLAEGDVEGAAAILPEERVYPLPPELPILRDIAHEAETRAARVVLTSDEPGDMGAAEAEPPAEAE